MDSNEIKRLSVDEMNTLIGNYNKPGMSAFLIGKFFAWNGDAENPRYTAADNSSGECFVEEFGTQKEAVYWLEHTWLSNNEVADMFDDSLREKRDEEAGYRDFRVYCYEKLSKDVVVRARSPKEAEEIADQAWSDGLIEVDWDNAESCTSEVQEERPMKHFGTDYEMYRRTVDGKSVEVF